MKCQVLVASIYTELLLTLVIPFAASQNYCNWCNMYAGIIAEEDRARCGLRNGISKGRERKSREREREEEREKGRAEAIDSAVQYANTSSLH